MAKYMSQSTGDRGLPCGVPWFMRASPLSLPSHHTLKRRSPRKAFTVLAHFLPSSEPVSALTIPSLLALLKAETISLPRRVACLPSASALSALLMVSIIASIAALPFLEPYWRLWNSSVASWSFAAITSSASFPVVLGRTIGRQPFTFEWSFPGLGIITIMSSCHDLGMGTSELSSIQQAISFRRALPRSESLADYL